MAAQSSAELAVRSALETTPFERVTFEAWTIGDTGLVKPHEIHAEQRRAESIAASMATEGSFGWTIAIRETDSVAGTAVLHFYRVRRGQWLGRRDQMGLGKKVYPYHADPLFKLQVKAFEPCEPWRWTPGCDVVGRDPDVIDMRAQ